MINSKKKKKIVWVTPDYFADCDIKVVPSLSKFYDITWFIIMPNKSRYRPEDFLTLEKNYKNLKVEIWHELGRMRDPMNSIMYWKLGRRIKQENADVIYLNISVSPWSLLMIPSINRKKAIVTAHQGQVHIGMAHKKMVNVLRRLWYGYFKNVNLFSKSQAELFRQDYPSSNIYQFVFGLKDFGNISNERPLTGDVRFLSFGTINYTKSIETLIDAACILYERGIRGFKVSINGMCKDWSWYQKKIKYPEIFETDIRMIENSEIPNLFNGSHYLVQPYRVVSQSGPTKIAFNYNLPIIVSNLPGFMDELKEGVNGYSFERGDVESLAERMQFLIKTHQDHYQELLDKMSAYTRENYSEENLVKRYSKMFTEVIYRCQ